MKKIQNNCNGFWCGLLLGILITLLLFLANWDFDEENSIVTVDSFCVDGVTKYTIHPNERISFEREYPCYHVITNWVV